MADPTQGQDPSMEEILASIRRIIDDDAKKADQPSETQADDDVLDLTDTAEAEARGGTAAAGPDAGDQERDSGETEEAQSEQHGESLTSPAGKRLISEAAMSSATAALGSLARASERDPLEGVARGRPVEELVMELLRPMLQEWLDENLPTIVERIVEREVRYLSRRVGTDDRA